VGAARLIRARASAVGSWNIWSLRSWDVWSLPRWLAVYVVAMIVADVAVVANAARYMPVHVHDLVLLAALLACSTLTVEMTRRAGEKLGQMKDVYAVWELPVAILLPIGYAPLVPIVRFALTQLRVRRAPLYRRAFSAAAVGFSYVAAAGVFRLVARFQSGLAADPARHALLWMLVVAGCAAVRWLANEALVFPAIKGSDPSVRLRDVFAWEPMHNDVTELCVAVLVTFCVANSIIALAFAFPFVTLLQRSLIHVQLLNDSRADSKTGLLNSATWEHEASTEVSRAVRTKTPVAVALLDLDKFKSINDTYGHLTGDQVIKEVARTLDTLLRDYDLAGRFGGEEFALLLPHTRSTDAFRIAERIRQAVAALRFIAPGASGGERLSVTVSIGVAALDGGDRREFADLLAAADAALYRAKSSGRDQVQMLSTTRGLSAIAGPGATRAVSDAHPEKPSVFRRAASS
jgi:diguanylate cyclase (GGDEF)-like protein